MWPFDRARRRRAAPDTVWDEWINWRTQRIDEGFEEWAYSPPRHGTWIEAVRQEWPVQRVWQAGAESPWMNTAALYWRPWHGETIQQQIIEAIR